MPYYSRRRRPSVYRYRKTFRSPFKRKPNKRYSRAVAGTRKPFYKSVTTQGISNLVNTSLKLWPQWPKAVSSVCTKLLKFIFQDDGFTLSPIQAAAYQDVHSYAGNSPFDPDKTGVGVQPYGWDQWTPTFFQKYRCLGSQITVYVTTKTASTTMPSGRLIIVPTRYTSLTNHDPSDLSQMPFARQRMLGLNTSSGCSIKLTSYASSAKVLSKSVAQGDDNIADYNADPTALWFWHVYLDSSEWAIEPDIRLNVKIKYYVQLSAPPSINES